MTRQPARLRQPRHKSICPITGGAPYLKATGKAQTQPGLVLTPRAQCRLGPSPACSVISPRSPQTLRLPGGSTTRYVFTGDVAQLNTATGRAIKNRTDQSETPNYTRTATRLGSPFLRGRWLITAPASPQLAKCPHREHASHWPEGSISSLPPCVWLATCCQWTRHALYPGRCVASLTPSA